MHQPELRAASDGAPPEWQPIPDNLESGNQSMMMAEGWKDVVLVGMAVPLLHEVHLTTSNPVVSARCPAAKVVGSARWAANGSTSG